MFLVIVSRRKTLEFRCKFRDLYNRSSFYFLTLLVFCIYLLSMFISCFKSTQVLTTNIFFAAKYAGSLLFRPRALIVLKAAISSECTDDREIVE